MHFNSSIKNITRFTTMLSGLLFILGLNPVMAKSNEVKSATKEIYKVVPAKSKLKWTGKKLTGEHFGTIKIKQGQLEFQGTQLSGGEFIVDMQSIEVDDLKDKEWNKKLKDHLESEDFFSVKKYPEAKLTITDAKFGKGGVYNITGDLVIKGNTKQILFNVNLDREKKKASAKGTIVFNRTNFDIKYRSGSIFDPKALGDKLIYDDVQLEVNLIAEKK